MDDNLITREIAAVLKAAPYTALAALVPAIEPAQAAATTSRPLLTVSGTWRQYGHGRRLGTLTLELRSRAGDQAEPAHHAAFDALFTAFLGAQGADAAASKASRADAMDALSAALAKRGNVTIFMLGPSEETVRADFDGEDLVTTLSLSLGWQFTPPRIFPR